MSDVKIELGATSADASIVIDGHNIAGHVVGFNLNADVRRVPELTLDLRCIEATKFESPHVQVRIDTGTARLLERAGWTPPPGHPSLLDRDERGCPCERKDVTSRGGKPETMLGRIVPTCPVHGVLAKDGAANG